MTYNQIQIMNSNIQKELQKQQSKQAYSIIHDREPPQQWYLKISPIIVGSNSWIIISKTIIFSITLLICLYYASSTYESSDKKSNGIFSIIFIFLRKQLVSQILLIICTISEAYVLQSIILLHIKNLHSIPLVSSINKSFDLYLPAIIQLNILLSYLTFLNQGLIEIKIISLGITNLTAVFSDFFLMPKNNPSDLIYTIETSFMVLFRCSFLLSLNAALVDYYINSSIISTAISFILIVILSYEFDKSGALIYNNQTSTRWFYVSYAVFMAINTTILLKLFMSIGETTPISLFFIILFKIYTGLIGYQNNPIFDNQLTLNDLKAFMAINLCMNEGISVIRKSLLIGLIQIHRNNCMSKNCISKRSSVSLQQQKLVFSSPFEDEQLETIIFYYTKCLFQVLLSKNSSDILTLICYCEYLLYEMKMILPLLIPISKLEEYKLNMSQQIRLQNLKDTIKEYLNKQNQVNQPKLILQEVISLENIYYCLKKAADQIVNKNIEIWQSFKGFISQAEIIQKLIQIISLKKTIKQNLTKSVNLNRHNGLKRLISFFKLYLNNDLKKQREISALSTNFSAKNQGQMHIYTISPLQAIITAQDCFSPYSIVILVKFSLQKTLIIQKVSKSVTNLLGYDENELNQVELSTILPVYLKQKHSRMMVSLIEEGFTSNQKSLKVVSTQCLKKDNTLVSACKSFKTYADVYGQVRFACILKVDPIQPIIIISSMKNKILQSSSNLQKFLSQQQENNKQQGISNFYHDILSSINNQSENNRKLEQGFTYVNNKRKQIKFRVNKIEYECHEPILSIVIIIPQQPQQKEYAPQSTQALRVNIQLEFKEQQKPFANIFMKEENFIPAQNLPTIVNIKRAVYVFGIIYLIFPTLVNLLLQQNCRNAKKYFDMKVFFINSLKSPYLLGVLYYQIQMNLSNDIDHLIHHTKLYQQQFLEKSLNPIMLKTIFDKSIFNEAFFQIEDYSANGKQLLSFDSKDVFFSISSFISSYKGLISQFSVQTFDKFNTMMILFFSEIDSIKNRLFQAYSKRFQLIILPDIIFSNFIIVVFIASVIVICYNFNKMFKIWTNLIKILSKTTNQQYKSSLTYWHQLKILLSPQESYQNLKLNSHKSSNRKSKQPYSHHFDQKNIKYPRLLPSGIIAMVTMLAIIFIIQYVKFTQIEDLRQFQEHGTVFLHGYPYSIVFSYCLLQRHYNQTVLKIIDQKSESFQSILKQFKQFSKVNYLAAPQQQDSQFYHLYKEYLFGNPCNNIPQSALIQGFTNQKCSTYAQGHLSSGIIAFERYTSELVQKTIENSYIFQREELKSLIESLVLTNALVEQMVKVWNNEYHQRLGNLLQYTMFFNMIAIIISVFIFYCFILRNFISKITDLEDLYKEAYSILMTKDKIQNNKIAQTQLILCGFLQKK